MTYTNSVEYENSEIVRLVKFPDHTQKSHHPCQARITLVNGEVHQVEWLWYKGLGTGNKVEVEKHDGRTENFRANDKIFWNYAAIVSKHISEMKAKIGNADYVTRS